MNQQEIADTLDVSQTTVQRIVQNSKLTKLDNLNESLLQEALEVWPDPDEDMLDVAEEIREEMIFAHWMAAVTSTGIRK